MRHEKGNRIRRYTKGYSFSVGQNASPLNLWRTHKPLMIDNFDGYKVDELYETHARTVTETDIVSFVYLIGLFEPLFIDMEFAKSKSLFGKRIAPGTLTFSLAEGLMAQSGLLQGGMALLAITKLRLPKPLYCGDTLKVQIKVLSKRETSKPDRGVITFSHRGITSDGASVIEYEATRMISRGTQA